MKPLNEIGLECKTDKSTMTHCYLDNYAKYFEPLRGKEFVLLEMGVAGGASIKMWREYFPNAKVYGIDNNPDCAGEGIFIGSQTDPAFLDSVLEKIGTPSIVIDDASHYAPNTIFSFRHLFKKVAPNGFYVVEDTHCFYDTTYGCAPPYGSGMSEVFNFFSGLTSHVDVHGRGMCGNAEYAINHGAETPPVPEFSRHIEAMHIYTSLWILERSKN